MTALSVCTDERSLCCATLYRRAECLGSRRHVAGEEGRKGASMERLLAASDQARIVRARLGKAGQTTGFGLLAPSLCGMHFARVRQVGQGRADRCGGAGDLTSSSQACPARGRLGEAR